MAAMLVLEPYIAIGKVTELRHIFVKKKYGKDGNQLYQKVRLC